MSQRHPITWQNKQANLISDEIEVLLASLSDVSSFREIVRESLSGVRGGKGTEIASGKPWYILPLIICEGISGHYEQATPASVALQLFMAAGEAFDDIEDADAVGSLTARYGSAIAINAATVLLILAEKAITRLREKGVTDCVIVSIMGAVNSFYSTACAGQHLDLFPTSKKSVSEDNYLRVASMKSATTMQCACHIGALLATTNQEIIDSFDRFGHNLGMASQIANDIQGIIQGSDIVKRKISLPVIYALAHVGDEAFNQLELAFIKCCESVPCFTQIRDLLFESGAIHYATLKMEVYKQLALDILPGLEKAGVNVERLKMFLE